MHFTKSACKKKKRRKSGWLLCLPSRMYLKSTPAVMRLQYYLIVCICLHFLSLFSSMLSIWSRLCSIDAFIFSRLIIALLSLHMSSALVGVFALQASAVLRLRSRTGRKFTCPYTVVNSRLKRRGGG